MNLERPSNSIKLRVSMMTAGIVAVVVTTLTVITAVTSAGRLSTETNRQLNQSAEMALQIFSSFKNVIDSNLDQWAAAPIAVRWVANPQLSAIFLNPLRAYVKSIRTREPWIENIVITSNGTVVYDDSSIPTPSDEATSAQQTTERTLEEEERSSHLERILSLPEGGMHVFPKGTLGNKVQKDVVVLKRPMTKSGAPLEGAHLLAILDLSKMNDHLFSRLGIGTQGQVTLVANAGGKLLVPQQAAKGTAFYDFSRAIAEAGAFSALPMNIGSAALQIRVLPDTPFAVAGIASLREAQEPIWSLVRTSALFGCLACLAGVLSAIYISGRLTTPILQLTEKVAQLGDGDYEVDFKITSRDEIGVLAKTFDVMARRIVDAHRTLSAYSKELEQKNEELSRMNVLKDQFLANTSHELRTPLNGIIGIVDSMLDDSSGTLSDHHQRNLAMVAQCARRLFGLVNDILDFSKLKHNKIELQITSVDVYNLAATVLMLSQSLVGKKSLRLINAVDSNCPAVAADENRLLQILHNLVGNAIKFSDNGTIEIRARVVDGFVEITVSDEGIGIPAERFESIFESFEQVDGSSSRSYGGAGLGLAVSKQLVLLHGGQIRVESALGQGSRFTFSLPLLQGKISITESREKLARVREDTERLQTALRTDPVGSRAVEVQKVVGKFTILVVDDEPVNLQVVTNHLSNQDFTIIQAANGFEALEIIQSGTKPDLVLMDVMMPRMSGFEAIQKIREQFHATELPIILLTAKNQVSDLVEGFALGANDFLSKPFSRNELLARINNHIHLSEVSLALARAKLKLEKILVGSQELASSHDMIMAAASAASRIISEIRMKSSVSVVSVHVEKGLLGPTAGPDTSRCNTFQFRLLPAKSGRQCEGVQVSELHSLVELEMGSKGDSACPQEDREADSGCFVQNGDEASQDCLFIALRHNKVRVGTMTVTGVDAKGFLPEDRNFVNTIANALALSLENMHFMQEVVRSEMRVSEARLEELGRIAVQLGDRINTPLNIIQLSLEELVDFNVRLSPSDQEEIQFFLKKIERSVWAIKSELGKLAGFKLFAPRNSVQTGFVPSSEPRSA